MTTIVKNDCAPWRANNNIWERRSRVAPNLAQCEEWKSQGWLLHWSAVEWIAHWSNWSIYDWAQYRWEEAVITKAKTFMARRGKYFHEKAILPPAMPPVGYPIAPPNESQPPSPVFTARPVPGQPLGSAGVGMSACDGEGNAMECSDSDSDPSSSEVVVEALPKTKRVRKKHARTVPKKLRRMRGLAMRVMRVAMKKRRKN
jgi:hypothetical protein